MPKRQGIVDLIPPDPKGLFHVYIARAQRHTSAPDVYHVGALLGVLSAIVSPHCKFSYKAGGTGGDPLHLWVMLYGPSGNLKTHSVDCATTATEEWLKERTFKPSGTLRGLEDLLKNRPDTHFLIREGGSFLAENKGRPGGVSPSWWCEAFDGVLYERAVRTGRAEFTPGEERRWLILPTIVAACATTALIEYSRPVDWSAGFFARMFFLHAPRVQKRIEHDEWTEADLDRISELVQRAETVAKRAGEVVWDQEARAVFSAWYAGMDDAISGLRSGPAAILERLDRHVRVVASLFALGCGTTVITGPIMRSAIALGRLSHESVLRICDSLPGR